MPKKKNRETSRLTHLAKARQKRQRDIEGTPGAWYSSVPAANNSISAETPEGNNVMPLTHHQISHPERSLDPGSDGDHNNLISRGLDGTPEQAKAAELSRKRPRASGQSGRTISRKKKAWKDLEAQGYMTLPDFFTRVTAKAEQSARLSALVAAVAAKPRSLHDVLNNPEEEEREQEDRRTAEERNIKTAVVLHNHKHRLEPNASRDMAQQLGFDGVDTPCVIEIDSEPIQVEDAQSEPSRPSPLESERAHPIDDEIDSRSCWKASPALFEESEESGDGCTTVGDDDESKTGAPSLRLIQRD